MHNDQPAAGGSPPNDLPPPPVPPGGSYFFEHLQFEARLRHLREKARLRSGHALAVLRLASLLLACWGLLLAYTAALHLLDWGTDGLAVLWGLPVSGFMLGLALLILVRGGRLTGYHYRRAWQALDHEGQSLLYSDDERLRLVLQRLAATLWNTPAQLRPFTDLTQRIEFCAFHLASLRALTKNPERLGWFGPRLDENARRFAQQLDNGAVVFAACLCGLLIGWFQLLLVLLGLFCGPAVIRGSAELAAFIDFYLEEPRLTPDTTPAAVPEQGWWGRLTAPWR